MSALLLLVSAVAAVAISYRLTGAVRGYALSHGLLDRPNERSSHTLPTPRGGGWGVVVPALAAVALACSLGALDENTALGLGVGGAFVAVVGWLDDRYGLSAPVRGAVHLAAAGWLVAWLGGVSTLDLGGKVAVLGAPGSILAIGAVAWSTNLYNFMDGIDGIAGLEAVTVGGVGGALLLAGGASGLALIAWATAGASIGFLAWNRPPARIFMGDVGSGFLGFLIAGLALAGEREGAAPALVWVVLLGVFVGDATFTLLKRIARQERWYAAHRGHAYQRLAQYGWSHSRVDLAFLGLNLPLSVMALIAWESRGLLPWVLALCSAVLLLAYILVERCHPLTSSSEQTP